MAYASKTKEQLEKKVLKLHKRIAELEEAIAVHNRKDEELKNSGRRYEDLVDNALVGIYRTNMKGDILYANNALANIFEFDSPKEMMSETVLKRYKNIKNRDILIQNLNRNGKVSNYEIEIVTKRGNSKHIILNAVLDGDNLSGMILDISDRKSAEQALRESQESLVAVLNSIEADIYVADLETHKILFLNKHMKDSFGGEPIGQVCWKVFRNESGPCSHCTNQRLLDKEGKPTGVCVWEGRNPITERDYINYDRAIKWIDGRMVRFQIAVDITDRKYREDALRQSEEHYRGVVEGSIQGIVIHQDSIIKFANEAAARMFCYSSPEDLVGRNVWTLAAHEEWPKLKSRNAQALRVKPLPVSHAWRGIRKNGTSTWVQSTASLVSWEGQAAVLSFYIDVSERMLAEKALRESEERYRKLVENLPVAVYRTTPGPKGKFSMANPTFLEMFGLTSQEELDELNVADVYMNPEDRMGFSDNLLVQGSIYDFELPLKKKDGTPFWGSVTARVQYDEHGEVPYFDCSIVDITARREAEREKKKLETQLRQSQKMEAIGTLAGGIAHDFNNILGAIIGYTELALLDTPEGTQMHGNMNEVLMAGARARDMVQQILTFSRKSEMGRKPVLIGPTIKAALKMMRSTLPSTIEIRQNIATDSDKIFADSTQIQQVLMNLCTNAAHAMGEKGGVLEVNVVAVDIDSDTATRHRDMMPGPYVRLTVSDTGHGMAPEILEKIFVPYFTTKEKGLGTGMGLAVVHGIVKNHGGVISVYSELGIGSTFNLYFPRVESEVAAESERFLPLLTGIERILFVDDEEALVEIGQQMLERLGYEVVARTSGIEALEAFRAQPERFDLVITDQTMPHLTGAALSREIRSIRPDIRIILCTGFSEHITEENAKEIGLSAFLMKPLVGKALAQTIRRVLDEEKKWGEACGTKHSTRP